MWELLTRKRVNKEHVTSDDLRTYKKILLMPATTWRDISPEVSLMSAEGKLSPKPSPLFSRSTKAEVSNRGYVVLGKNTEMSASGLY